MKNNQPFVAPILGVLFTFLVGMISAQNGVTYNLGNEADFSKTLLTTQKISSDLELKVSESQSYMARINVKDVISNEEYFVTGVLKNVENGTFSISKANGLIEGHILLSDKGYQYTLNSNQEVLLKQKDLGELICVGVEKVGANNATPETSELVMAPILNSLPGATAVVYLDFDGEVVSGTSWAGGATINAKPEGYSENEMRKIWEYVAEDFSPFQVNVTTDRAVYNKAPKNKRMMTIFTTTTTAAPGSGGVAFLNSFSSNRDDPCWVFNGRPGSIKAAGETASHEVGHTVGLRHDGQGSNTYYQGNGVFCPIMGGNFRNPVGHWSKGEYTNANLFEDDLAIITRSRNFGYKNDDHGNSRNNATKLVIKNNGSVDARDNKGVIEKSNDKDLFSFNTEGGEIDLKFKPASAQPNLNIQARILDSSGKELAKNNPKGGDLSAAIKMDLKAGTYYVEIDGKGEGNQSNGYAEYGSLGVFSISGKIVSSSSCGSGNTATVDASKTKYDYDVGTPCSPIMNNWAQISDKTTGDIKWNVAVKSGDRGESQGVNKNNQDFVFSGRKAVLSHKLRKGSWEIVMNMGDAGFPHDNMRVTAEGIIIGDNINSARGEFPYVTGTVDVSDGELNIEIEDRGGNDPNWVLNRLSIEYKGVLSAETNEINDKFVLYPNPVKDILNLNFLSSKTNTNRLVYIYDTIGKQLMKKELSADKNSIDASALQSGVYYLKVVETNRVVQTVPFVKD